jgi:hypothetical protein
VKILEKLGLGPSASGDPRTGRSAPGYSECGRCRTAWAFVDGHLTQYSDGSGCFPLCEGCWEDLTPEERLPFYRTLHQQWAWGAAKNGYTLPDDWGAIEQAVLAGK